MVHDDDEDSTPESPVVKRATSSKGGIFRSGVQTPAIRGSPPISGNPQELAKLRVAAAAAAEERVRRSAEVSFDLCRCYVPFLALLSRLLSFLLPRFLRSLTRLPPSSHSPRSLLIVPGLLTRRTTPNPTPSSRLSTLKSELPCSWWSRPWRCFGEFGGLSGMRAFPRRSLLGEVSGVPVELKLVAFPFSFVCSVILVSQRV